MTVDVLPAFSHYLNGSFLNFYLTLMCSSCGPVVGGQLSSRLSDLTLCDTGSVYLSTDNNFVESAGPN